MGWLLRRTPRYAHRLWVVGLGLTLAPLAATPALEKSGLFANNSRRSPVVDVVEKVRGAVVNIHSERTVSGPNDDLFHLNAPPSRVNGMGTGIIIDPRGYIVTNHHVIEDVHVIRARLSDGTTYSARILARDPETDLALLKIDAAKPLPTIPLGTASDLMVGETVIAIGNAFGYEHTVTTGVVSALKRDVALNKELQYKSLIQTDASINPGNSGGPLVNINGELIGVNVAIRAGAQGIGFAIPVDQMIRVTADLISGRKKGLAAHTLGLRDKVETGTTPLQRSLMVERGDTGDDGLKSGDVVVRVAEQPVTCSLDFERALIDRPTGEKVSVLVKRDGAERPVELVVKARERTFGPGEQIWRRLGVRLQAAPADIVTRVKNELHGGLLVSEINTDGVAFRAGIQRGDILIGLHDWETLNYDNVLFVLNHPDLATFNPVKFFVIRGGQVRRGYLPQLN